MHTQLLLALGALALPSFAAAQTCGALWAQCGGVYFSGPKCCQGDAVCVSQGDYYAQCLPKDQVPVTKDPNAPTDPPTPPPTNYSGPMQYATYDTTLNVTAHAQGAYPTPDSSSVCSNSNWALADNVCVPKYCSNDNKTDSCSGCTGQCVALPADTAKSGTMWGEKTTFDVEEKWHYSRSSHYGITTGGACAFGLYGICTNAAKNKETWIDSTIGDLKTQCDAFCKAYPALCQDPTSTNVTVRGNFAAPNGNYYTQFWAHLSGQPDNYLSCGECFEVARTKPDGTDYKVGETGYTDPVILQITDSCPCETNAKWCCGSGYDHCGEIGNFKYGCPLPKDSTHLDLGDIAMARLQGDSTRLEGVIPTRYRRVACPMPGNVYIWLEEHSDVNYLTLSFVNAAGVGSIAKAEIMPAGKSSWIPLVANQDYTKQRPQTRYGAWTTPKKQGPWKTPIALRITSPNGEQLVNMEAIKSLQPNGAAIPKFYYIDFGLQFSLTGKH